MRAHARDSRGVVACGASAVRSYGSLAARVHASQRASTPRRGQLAPRAHVCQAVATTEEHAMKALVFAESGQPLHLEQRATPQPEPGDLLVKVAYCGICGSDVHATDPGPFQIGTG